jgi:hypothetical protein
MTVQAVAAFRTQLTISRHNIYIVEPSVLARTKKSHVPIHFGKPYVRPELFIFMCSLLHIVAKNAMWACSIQLENGWSDLHGFWYGDCAIRGLSKFVLRNFLQSIIQTRRMLKVMRWEDDPPSRSHYLWCHLSVMTRAIPTAIYQWSYDLSDITFIPVSALQNNQLKLT